MSKRELQIQSKISLDKLYIADDFRFLLLNVSSSAVSVSLISAIGTPLSRKQASTKPVKTLLHTNKNWPKKCEKQL
jgi:hypothetical protein